VAAGKIQTRRWNDPARRGEGTKLLITRWRPRGVRKQDETWDVWSKELSPSAELLAAFQGKQGKPISWGEYRRGYRREMIAQAQRIGELAAQVKAGKNLTLLCSSHCLDERQCHRTVLRDLILVKV
jgi:uncharacterized protein YeaO (DUF488 family)